MSRRDPRWIGITKHGTGWRAAVSRGRHQPKLYGYFPAHTAVEDMQAWREDEKAKLRITRKQRASFGTFEGDARRRYLPAVKALPTYAERKRHIEFWIGEFGTRRRDAITSAEIRAVRDRLLTTPRAKNQPPLSPHTVNLMLRALSNVWTVLDGSRAYNPARDVPEAQEPSQPPRTLDLETIQRILDAMPDRGFRPKGVKVKDDGDRPSLAKARIAVLAWTGWPAKVLMAMTPGRIDWRHRVAHLPERTKGRGAPAVSVPLTEQAVSALQHLDAVQGWGRFSVSTLGRAFRRACRAVGLSGVRVYDLRHAFLTRLAWASKDERAVQTVAQHRSLTTTRRYTQASVDPRVAAAMAAMASFHNVGPSAKSLPRKAVQK